MTVEKIDGLSPESFPPIIAFVTREHESGRSYRGVIVRGDQVTHYVKPDSGKRYAYSSAEMMYFTSPTDGQPYTATPIILDNGQPPSVDTFLTTFFTAPAEHDMDDIITETKNDLRKTLQPEAMQIVNEIRHPATLPLAKENDRLALQLTDLVLSVYPDHASAEDWLPACQAHRDFAALTQGTSFPAAGAQAALAHLTEVACEHLFEIEVARTLKNVDKAERGLTDEDRLQVFAQHVPTEVFGSLRQYRESINALINPPGPDINPSGPETDPPPQSMRG